VCPSTSTRTGSKSLSALGELFGWLPPYVCHGTASARVHICLFSRHGCGTDFDCINCGTVAPAAWQDVACNQAGSVYTDGFSYNVHPLVQ